jgi:poly(A) polymerase
VEGVNPRAAAAVRRDVKGLARTPSGIGPPPLLTGDDLVAQGLKPGPAFKRILDLVYDAQLEDRVRTLEEARELARALGV